MSMEKLQEKYREYMESKGVAANTVSTSSIDAFYLWRHVGEAVFWKVIRSKSFEADARAYIGAAQEVFSKVGEKKSNVNSYIHHLRSVKSFIEKKSFLSPEQLPVPEPLDKQIKFYLALWRHLDSYRLQESALNRLFAELCPENKRIEDILIKTSALNDFYSTNIYSIYPVAMRIKELNIDQRLQEGDISLVDDIRKVTVGEKTRDYYSFATKYCSHHKPEAYPIYDSYVDKVLCHFRDEGKLDKFKNKELKNYAKFKSVLEEFMGKYSFTGKRSLKEIDQYLWQLGKDCFPRNY